MHSQDLRRHASYGSSRFMHTHSVYRVVACLVHPQDLVDSLEEQLVATNGATAASSQQAVLATADAAMLKVRGWGVGPTAAWVGKTAG